MLVCICTWSMLNMLHARHSFNVNASRRRMGNPNFNRLVVRCEVSIAERCEKLVAGYLYSNENRCFRRIYDDLTSSTQYKRMQIIALTVYWIFIASSQENAVCFKTRNVRFIHFSDALKATHIYIHLICIHSLILFFFRIQRCQFFSVNFQINIYS